jgi:hypothetical protein
MAYKVEARSLDRKGNPKRKFTFFGKTKKAAMSNARGYFRKARNCEAGVMDDAGVFHPIEAESPRAQATNRRRRNRSRRLRNIAEGYYDATGFHPIRASADYDPSRVRHGSGGSASRKQHSRVSSRAWSQTSHRKRASKARRSKNVRRTAAHGPRATNRRRKNKMPPALARYWRKVRAKKNRRRR